MNSFLGHLTRALMLYKKNFKIYSFYILLSVIAPFLQMLIIVAFGFISFTRTLNDILHGTASFATVGIPLLIMLGGTLIVSIISLWFSIAFQRVIFATRMGEDHKTIKQQLGESFRILPRAFVTSLIFTAISVGPILVILFLFIVRPFLSGAIPLDLMNALTTILLIALAYSFFHALFFSIRYVFAIFEVIINSSTIKQALRTSSMISRGNWWYIAIVIFGTTLLTSLISQPLFALNNYLFQILPRIPAYLVWLLFSILFFYLYQYILIVFVDLYATLKTRYSEPQKPTLPSQE